MAQIIWTQPALDDINEIAEYISLDNIAAAKTLVKNIFDSVKRLRAFPESGKIPSELDDFRYREIIVGPCRIFYRIDQAKIYVLYVMRSERSLRNFILYDRSKSSP